MALLSCACSTLAAAEAIAENAPVASNSTTPFTIEPPNFNHISQIGEFQLGYVKKIFQDREGFIWLATKTGLVKYDGYEAKIFQHDDNNPHSISSNNIIDIIQGSDHFLWISTAGGGLNKFNPSTEVFKHFIHDPNNIVSLSDNDMSYLTWFDTNVLLVSTSKGLNFFNTINNQVSLLSLPDAPNDTTIMNTLLDSHGMLWIATIDNGLYQYDPNTHAFEHYQHQIKDSNSLSSNDVYALFEGSQNEILIGTKKGLNILDTINHIITRVNDKDAKINTVLHSMVTVITRDNLHHLWIGTLNNGFINYDPSGGLSTHYDKSDLIFSIFQDQNELLWLGTGGGIYTLDLNQLIFKQLSTTLAIHTVAIDNNHTIWLANDHLSRFNQQNLTATTFYTHTNIKYIAPSTDSLLTFVNMRGSAIEKFSIQDEKITDHQISFKPENSNQGWVNGLVKHGNTFWYVLSDYNTSANTGLFKYNQHSGVHQAILTSISPQRLLELSPSTLLVLTKTELILYDIQKQSSETIYSTASLGSPLTCFYKDPQQRVWVCMGQVGLGLYESGRDQLKIFKWNKSEITSIVSDEIGILWLGTNNGVVKFNPSDGRFKTYNQFGSKTALICSPINGIKTTNNSILIMTNNGLLYFNPKELHDYDQPVTTVITDLKLLNRSVKPQSDDPKAVLHQTISQTDQITLGHRDYLFSFSFASLEYLAPQTLKYAYQMEGLDEEWIYTDANNRVATYTTLPAGDYTFKVKGSNINGDWNEGSSIAVTILAPWWATRLAYVSYFVISALLAWLLYSIRTKRYRMRTIELEQAVEHRTKEVTQLLADKDRLIANISHEFRTPLTLILGPLENELQSSRSAKSQAFLALAKANGQRLLAMVDQLLDIARIKDHYNHAPTLWVNVSEVGHFLIESYRSLAQQQQISLTLHNHPALLANDGKPAIYVKMQPDALEKILSNLLTNAFKYTDGHSSVILDISLTAHNQVQLQVIDTGIGISLADQQQIFERFSRVDSNSRYIPGAGIGLALVKELVEQHQGTITVASELSQGSTFTVLLPLAAPPTTADNIGSVNQMLVLSALDQLNHNQINEQPAENNETSVSESSSQKPTLVIIEDNHDMRHYIIASLNDSYHCLSANDGEAGIRLVQQTLPDLVISDVMMPLKDGFAVTQALKSDLTTNHIPIILLTAHGDSQSRIRGWTEKADEFIEKPFNTAELRSRIDNLLGIRHLLSQRYQRAFTTPANENEPVTSESTGQDSEPSINLVHQVFIDKITEVLEAHYPDEHFDVNHFATQMCISSRQLSRKIKSLLDLTPKEAIRSFRLKKAAQLLKQGHPVGIVAFEVGFGSHSYFAQCFKAHFDCLPSQYTTDVPPKP